MSNKKESLIERLEKGVALVVEGYILELERRGYLKAGPHHIRAMAEALGRKVPASKYSLSINLRYLCNEKKLSVA